MALSEIDRRLLERCLAHRPGAWEDFTDRFLGLVVHVVSHTSQARAIRLSSHDLEDFCAEVFLAIVKDDFAVLRNFRGQSSLATYLTVIARRVVVRSLVKRQTAARLAQAAAGQLADTPAANANQDVANRDELERLISALDDDEADIVRMFHLEGKTYHEISAAVGLPENSVGPTLSRAREKMRLLSASQASR